MLTRMKVKTKKKVIPFDVLFYLHVVQLAILQYGKYLQVI